MLVALYELNQPCFEDKVQLSLTISLLIVFSIKLFSAVNNALHAGQGHEQGVILNSQLVCVFCISSLLCGCINFSEAACVRKKSSTLSFCTGIFQVSVEYMYIHALLWACHTQSDVC